MGHGTDADVDPDAALAAAERLRAAADELEECRQRRADTGPDRDGFEAVADACRNFETVLDRWEERATDWDDFEGYVEFRDDLAGTLEAIPDDVPEREAFLEADEHVTTDSVSTALDVSDFDAAREALAPARRYADLRDDIETAKENKREAVRRARRRRDALEARIGELERLRELGEADFDAPIERLREPIDAYNGDVTEDFRAFRNGATARTVLEFAATAAGTPFVEYEAPPSDLLEYVRSRPAGEMTVDELLTHAGYSRSKLSHYVDDADLLKRRVATNRTYLERLSAAPFEIEWPPPPAERLRYRIGELVSLLDRFADEETIARLREVGALARGDEYGRIRRAAAAAAELTAAERRRIEAGEVDAELEAARGALEDLEAALEAHA